jgi:hypothetical protein
VNWVWELETLPTAWSQGVIVNLFGWRHTAAREGWGDHPGINLPQDVYKHVAQAHESKHLHEAQAAFRSKDPADNLFVLTRILKEAGKANKTVYAFFLDVRKAYDTVWRDGLSISC